MVIQRITLLPVSEQAQRDVVCTVKLTKGEKDFLEKLMEKLDRDASWIFRRGVVLVGKQAGMKA